MKILICTGLYPPDIGGPATYSKILADELPKHGIETKILSFGCVRCLPKIIRHIVYFLKVLKFGKSVDLIFALDPVSVGLPSFFAAKILRKKFALKIVGDYAWEMHMQKSEFKTLEKFQTERYDFITELRRKIERCVAKGADKIIVPSQYLKKIVLMWKVKEEKINVINNSFELPAFTEKLDLPGFNIVSVGRLVPWKGFQALEEIIPEIKKEIPDTKLKIINNALHEEVLKYLRSSDIFVLNTGYEGFSHLILEAMAMEIPVITTSVGGNPEIIDPSTGSGQVGILVEYNNKEQLKSAILMLYKDKELREKLIKNAQEKVKQFNKEKMIKETIKILSF
ncbi:glycosyltransferase family 4 protein [Patescibacteria group bacterium]|nr:glycosyltransferase family 4 protein [Patescibacteria group bacterium]